MTYASVTLQTTKTDSQTRVYMEEEGGEIRGLVKGGGGNRLSFQELINGRRFSTRERNVSRFHVLLERKIPIVGMDLSGRLLCPGKSNWIKILYLFTTAMILTVISFE